MKAKPQTKKDELGLRKGRRQIVLPKVEQAAKIKPMEINKVFNRKDDARKFVSTSTLGEPEYSDFEMLTCKFDPSDKYIACGFGDGVIVHRHLEYQETSIRQF